MRKSSLRHPVAVLRAVIGVPQPEFSRTVGIAESTLAKIESLRLPLSKENAIRISENAGVSMRWLLEGDPTTPPIADGSRFGESHGQPIPFTRETFEECRAQVEAGDSPSWDCTVPHLHLDGIAAAVEGTGKERMFNYKVTKAVADLEREFGRDKESEQRAEALMFAERKVMNELVKSKTEVLNAVRGNDVSPLRSLHCALLKYLVQLRAIPPSAVPAERGKPTSTITDEAQDAGSAVQAKNRKVKRRAPRGHL